MLICFEGESTYWVLWWSYFPSKLSLHIIFALLSSFLFLRNFTGTAWADSMAAPTCLHLFNFFLMVVLSRELVPQAVLWTSQFSNNQSYELQCAPVLLTFNHVSEQQHVHYSRTFAFYIPSFVNRAHHKLKAPDFRALTHLGHSVSERNNTVSFCSTGDNSPIAIHVVRFLSVQTLNALPCHRVIILGLYLIWGSCQGARHCDVDSMAVCTQFRVHYRITPKSVWDSVERKRNTARVW